MENNIVYVLTNSAMPGLTKIGMTNKTEIEKRMKELFTTGVPVPFDCVYACQVKDASEVEKTLHFAFGDARVNPNRDFFQIEPERVVAILKLLKAQDITNDVEKQLDSKTDLIDRQSAENLKKVRRPRPRLNFSELGIGIGSVLVFDGNTEEIVKVAADNKVEYKNEICSLTMATRKILGLPDNTPLRPAPYWLYNGEKLLEIYERYHNNEDE